MPEKKKNFLDAVDEKITDVLDGADNKMGTEDDFLHKTEEKAEELFKKTGAKVKDVFDGKDNVPGTKDDFLEQAKDTAKGAFEKVKDVFDGDKKK
jgi:hypothetical protein